MGGNQIKSINLDSFVNRIIKMLQKRPTLIVLLILVAIAAFYNYFSIYSEAGYSNHAWRQSDCLSFAVNYYQEGMHFLQPKLHFSNVTGDGKTVSEFPIIYYSVATLWKIFGKHYFIFRLVNTLIVFIGFLCLFRMCRELFKSKFWAGFIVVLLFTSPVLAYYTNTFMADAPAFGLSLIAWYFFRRYTTESKVVLLYTCMFFFLMAGLLKPSALLGFGVLLGIFGLELSGLVKFKNEGKLFQHRLHTILSMSAVIIGMIGWISYAVHYNSAHNNNIFLVGILPIWEMSTSELFTNMHALFNELLPQLFPTAGFYGLIFSGIILATRKSAGTFYRYLCGFLLIGFVTFLILFFQVFNVHEYYLLNMVILVPGIAIALIVYLQKIFPQLLQTRGARFSAGLLLFFLVINCGAQVRMRYNSTDFLGKNYPWISETQAGFNTYLFQQQRNFQDAYLDASPWLRSLGITRDEKIISIPDQSPNVTLSKLDQKGYTDFFCNGVIDSTNINSYVNKGVKYLLIGDTTIIAQRHLESYVDSPLGHYKNLVIYRLPSEQK